ncbi:hypothetical protein D3C72_1248110 [compost metagenome]
MKHLFLITVLLMMSGIAVAQAGRCSQSDVKRGCHTELGAPSRDWPHGRPSCVCDSNRNDELILSQSDVFDVILKLDGQERVVRCCARGTLCGHECDYP